jgi:two-component system nitrate/nitrite response regulator NarL
MEAVVRADGAQDLQGKDISSLTPTPTIDIVIATDIRFYRDGLARALVADRQIAIAGVASTLDETLTTVSACHTAVVLIDAGMPDARALAATLLKGYPEIKLVALAVRDHGPDVLAWAEIGVHAYVTRDESLEQLLRAIERVVLGESSCSPRVTAFLLAAIGATAAGRSTIVGDLTSRELEIIKLVAAHLTNKEIAQRLHIELPTVKNHIHNSFEKLHIQHRTEAAARLRRT